MNWQNNVFFFIVRVLLLFLMFLALYYWASPFLLLFTAKFTHSALVEFFPRFIASVTLINHDIEVITFFSTDSGQANQLAFDMNPLKYSYGFPLFCALIFSSFGQYTDKLLKCLLAYFVISITQVWGISFDIIRHLVFEFNGAYTSYFDFSASQTMMLSYGSQLGFLLLPSLTPIVLWVYLDNKQFKKLLQQTALSDNLSR